MSKGDTFENDFLKLVYQGVAIANLADNAVTGPLASIFYALHSADPGEAGTQSTNEVAYTGYARVGVARSAGGHTVTGNAVSPVAAVTFGACTVGTVTALFFSTGVAISGATKILHKGPIGSALGPFTATALDVVTLPGLSGVALDDRIAFFVSPASTLPGGIVEGTVYWVKTVAGNDITLSATQGGITLDITSAGDGTAFRVTPLAIAPLVTPSLTTATTITED